MSSLLQPPSLDRRSEFLSAVARSRDLHGLWVSPPATPEAFEAYVELLTTSPTQVGYWIRTEGDELAGVVHISEIVRGAFCSAYLGYYAFVPHAGRGYMTRGLSAVVSDAFGPRRLHRLEANIQPGNEASRQLVRRLGFRLEGFSPRYLRIAGEWRDHERWAITAEEWEAERRVEP